MARANLGKRYARHFAIVLYFFHHKTSCPLDEFEFFYEKYLKREI